ncbi:hypothetical protein [Mageeibacillus indolicus]|uniref:Uncharacterized protein n=2 Tax=Mageeibacillus indolicus TaxID=884684 RepID=D3QZ05_MAGIU|nr:hypothetical protein [Mageeibacillus indolicus]ADC90387.1 hypothetical protein HMPREF0868_1435 [Mageeibacillus indolicus UPII9-5]KFA56915.1 hypothetical protein HMPREF1632_07290 [Mageeibacillus indolicus 0009-5]PNH18009.1 hypothetical protein B7R76_06640 [Mageeibacillus indolicus]
MNKEIFAALQAIEDEAEQLVEQARHEVDTIKTDTESAKRKLKEAAELKIAALRQETEKTIAVMRTEWRKRAAQDLTEAEKALTEQAEQHYAAAVDIVVKECLTHGHR